MMPGETIYSGASPKCDCGTGFKLEVLKSNAGYYIGTTCRNPECEHFLEPNSRESHYYPDKASAEADLASGEINWRT